MANRIVENCGNTLILRCSASEGGGTSRFASTLIGQREVLRSTRSRSRRPGEFLNTVTHGEHVSIEPAVMDSQIEQLPDLAGYLKFASHDRWRRVTLSAPHREANRTNAAQVPAYIPVLHRVPMAAPATVASPVTVTSVAPGVRRLRRRTSNQRSGSTPSADIPSAQLSSAPTRRSRRSSKIGAIGDAVASGVTDASPLAGIQSTVTQIGAHSAPEAEL